MTKSDVLVKVFGIGLNKTGTTTLGQCGRILGYRCTSCDRDLLERVVLHHDWTGIKKVASQYDLFEDWPWALIYKKLDRLYPGSRFILTVRKNERVWLESLKKHSMRTHPVKHCRKLVYGYNFPHKHEQEYLEFYRRHNDSVRSYFRHRDRDFIEICWENGDGFEKLCDFLGKSVPDTPLPHANRSRDVRVTRRRLLANRVLSVFA